MTALRAVSVRPNPIRKYVNLTNELQEGTYDIHADDPGEAGDFDIKDMYARLQAENKDSWECR